MSDRPRTALMAHPSAELYGSDRTFLESVLALRGTGWQVVVALPTDGPLVARIRATGASVVRCPTAVLRKAALRPRGLLRLVGSAIRAVIPMLRLLRIRPDLVYVSTITVPMWPLLARLTGHRVMSHVHEAEAGMSAVVAKALVLPVRAARLVLVNSSAARHVLLDSAPALSGKVRLVYNGVAGPDESPEVPRPAPKNPVRIVLVGRISPRKGTDTAVAALAQLTAAGVPATLTVTGSVFPGYEWFADQVRELADELRVTEFVRFTGFRANVWESYLDADIAIVPSRVEPFGNAAVEAQLAGVPVVVTNVQGLPETVGDGRFGAIVPADDPTALAATIRELITNWPDTAETAGRALVNAQHRFTPSRYHTNIAEAAAALANQ